MSYQHFNLRVLWFWRRSERVNDEMTMVELTCEMTAVEITFDEKTTKKMTFGEETGVLEMTFGGKTGLEKLREWMRRIIENKMTVGEITFFEETSDELADVAASEMTS
ncbi:hypothetical protein M0802_016157 [Mischocyttarus mexicanus]|nr:hypothetical protein M0802_016157 [Mischocyttarus mexicanus]